MADTPAARGMLERVAHRFTAWAERWIPDAYIFALLASVVVIALALGVHVPRVGLRAAAGDVTRAWGRGLWELLPFTLQMSLVIITGHVLASAPPVFRLIERLARVPRTARHASAWVALFSMVASWFNWGFSLVFGAMLAKQVARQLPRADYRTLCASSLLGLGSVWAQGLSGSAALQMATPGALPAPTRAIIAGTPEVIPHGILPLSRTIFLWQSFVTVAVELVVVTLVIAWCTPDDTRTVTARDLDIPLDAPPAHAPPPVAFRGPGERIEHARWIGFAFVVPAVAHLVLLVLDAHRAGNVLGAIDLNAINLTFLTLGVALHGTPARLMNAFRDAVPGVWGVLLQFPLYAALASVIVKTGLNDALAHALTRVATRVSFPAITAVYSAVLGVFVPSGGAKWVIEAPYVMKASHALRVNLGWSVAVYDLGEALANLVQPFWMLPVLGLFRLRARDVMGVTVTVFVVLTPLVLVMVTLLGMTLEYP